MLGVLAPQFPFLSHERSSLGDAQALTNCATIRFDFIRICLPVTWEQICSISNGNELAAMLFRVTGAHNFHFRPGNTIVMRVLRKLRSGNLTLPHPQPGWSMHVGTNCLSKLPSDSPELKNLFLFRAFTAIIIRKF